jgi:uncharacterized protein (DUF2236 family)
MDPSEPSEPSEPREPSEPSDVEHRETSEASARADDVFEGLVARVRAEVPDARAGLFGPRSLVWRVLREMALFLGGPRAVLLQLGHPAIAAAIAEHSDVHRDPLGRARRTFEAMMDIVFGDLEAAVAAARRIRRRHLGVRGTIPGTRTAYDAFDLDPGRWVLATLIDTTFTVFDAVVRPLTVTERAEYYEEQKKVGALLGVPPERMPSDVRDFDAYVQSTVAMLDVGPIARDQFAALVDAPPSAYASAVLSRDPWSPMARVMDAPLGRRFAQTLAHEITAALLPPRIREAYGLPSPRFAARSPLVSSLARVYRALPAPVRFHPAYHRAVARTNVVSSQKHSRRTRRTPASSM